MTEEEIMAYISGNINTSLEEAMKENTTLGFMKVFQIGIGKSIDKLAADLKWSADRKARFVDKFLDIYNEIKKE